jgi:serine protease
VKRTQKVLVSAAATIATLATVLAIAFAPGGSVANAAAGGTEVLHGAHIMGVRGAKANPASTTGQLYYHGGTGGVGVETGSDLVYIVFWGPQWSSDPSGEAALMQNFFNHVGGSSWNNSVTQYCEGVPSGTYFCNGAGTAATNPTGVLAGTWYDSSSLPKRISQSALASEASKAASHFGNSNHTQVQYVVATPTGHSMNGFGTQWCAWHSSTSSSYGTIAYTYMPYITDAGSSCGANFNGLGANAGITIVGGHEFAETESDIYPSSGWTDSSGAENGDKCAWSSATANESLNGVNFPVQPLWSNNANSQSGGCVQTYP